MAKRESVFADEWRRCLREHYKYVIKTNDTPTATTLTPILERFGFRSDELRQLEIEATIRADDMPDDFVPDMQPPATESVEVVQQPQSTFITHEAECTCPSCMDQVLEIGHDEDGQPLAEPQEQADQPDDDLPKQKSLF
ncbi:MAG: hypothetical protein ACFE0Q_16135 [Anaerolineae bacterium]